MKIILNKKQLKTAVNRVQGAISDRSLAQIGLKAESGQLKISAADHILAIYNVIDSNVEQEGCLFIPAKLFTSVVKELPDGDVELYQASNFLVIESLSESHFEMKLPIIDSATWREPPEFNSENKAVLPSGKICYMIEQVQFCVSQDSPRNYGTVGYLHKPDSGKVRLVGTDGFRLSYCDFTSELPATFLSKGISISKRGLAELLKMSTEGFEEVILSIDESETTLLAEVADYQIFIRLSAVKYPNYQGVLPTANLTPVDVSRPTFQTVAKRVLLASDQTNALQLSFADSSLTLIAKTVGSSEGKESIEIPDYKGDNKELTVNGRFLTDVFSTVQSEDLSLQFRNETDPVVVMPKDEPYSCHSLHVLVPIRES